MRATSFRSGIAESKLALPLKIPKRYRTTRLRRALLCLFCCPAASVLQFPFFSPFISSRVPSSETAIEVVNGW
jgi:hypothetical protein